MVLLGLVLVFGVFCVYIFGFLVFILVVNFVIGLFCQYHNQVIGWRLVSRGAYTLGHSLTVVGCDSTLAGIVAKHMRFVQWTSP